jgi:hypothetical protein
MCYLFKFVAAVPNLAIALNLFYLLKFISTTLKVCLSKEGCIYISTPPATFLGFEDEIDVEAHS